MVMMMLIVIKSNMPDLFGGRLSKTVGKVLLLIATIDIIYFHMHCSCMEWTGMDHYLQKKTVLKFLIPDVLSATMIAYF